MIKKLINLAVVALIVYALYHVAPVWLHYFTFKDAVKEMALFSKEKTDAGVIDRVMAIAQESGVPLAREYVEVRRAGDRLYITAAYVEVVKIVPGYDYSWQFQIEATGLNAR